MLAVSARAACVTLLFAASGCVNLPPEVERELDCAPPGTPNHFSNAPSCAAAALRDHPVSLIVNEHPNGGSLFLSLVAGRFAPYTHIGLVVAETEGTMVYESMGAILPLPWRKPSAWVGGGVRRVSLESFLERGGITAIHALPAGTESGRVAQFARDRWRERRAFDAHYDPRDDAKYYCVEFVARALESGGAAPFVAAPTSRNRSIRVALDWLDITTPEMLLAGDLIVDAPRLALFSRRFTAAEVARYFELKREVHRRFTDDQRVGNVVEWRKQRLWMRPDVDRYFEEGLKLEVDARQLAVEILGPMPGDVSVRVAGSR
jgi:hypothetical protein